MQHTTFEKCLFAMSINSGTFCTTFKSNVPAKDITEKEYFKSGFIRVIKLRELGDQAKIIWGSNIDDYLAAPRIAFRKEQTIFDYDSDWHWWLLFERWKVKGKILLLFNYLFFYDIVKKIDLNLNPLTILYNQTHLKNEDCIFRRT